MQRPQNILDIINENINITNQNVLTLIEHFTTLRNQLEATQQEVIALTLMLKAPEEPNVVSGEKGAVTE